MTEISVVYSEGRPVALNAAGHSDYAPEGSDIVCAGVSALLQALLYGFERVLKDRGFRSRVDEVDTVISLDWRLLPPDNSALLVETIIGSLKEIARAYPEHVRILEVDTDDYVF
ncbi:MAG: ribosomal-processing cysteine protease Prp [Aminobacteriaceae bacterium]